MFHPHCTLQTCNGPRTQTATSERVVSKTRVDPFFCSWLIKYGRKSGFSLSNSVDFVQTRCEHAEILTYWPMCVVNHAELANGTLESTENLERGLFCVYIY